MHCSCGSVHVQLQGAPLAQFVCHCDACQAVHGNAYLSALYPSAAVSVTRGETDVLSLRTTPRTKCASCGTFLFAEVPGLGVRGVNGSLFQAGTFRPQFHVQCTYALAPIEDELPHFAGLPARFGGSDELVQW
ncbi:GFA family protein [Polaromonas sp. P5_D5]